jgi:hypothetical protein
MRYINNLIIGGILAISVVGCTGPTKAEIEADRIKYQIRNTMDDTTKCQNRFKNKSEYKEIEQKIALFEGRQDNPSDSQVKDQTYPTEQDIVNINRYIRDDTKCFDLIIQDLGRIDPKLVIILTNAQTEWLRVVQNDINEKKHTFGYINLKAQQIARETRSSAQNWESEFKQKLVFLNKSEIEEKRARQREFWSDLGQVTAVVAAAAVASVSAYGAAKLASEEKIYSDRKMNMESEFNNVSCFWVGGIWTCSSY